MYTLLLPEQKKQVRMYTYSRYALLGVKILTVVGMVLCIALVPSYLLVRSEYVYVSSCLSAYDSDSLSPVGKNKTPADGILKEGEYVREIVMQHSMRILPREVFDAVISTVSEYGVVRSFSYNAQTKEVSIDGSAPDREALVEIMEALRANERFATVPRITDVLQQDSKAFRVRFLYVPEEKQEV